MKYTLKPLAVALAACGLLYGCSQTPIQEAATPLKSPTLNAYCPVDDTEWLAFAPAEHPDLWQRIRAGMQIEPVHNERVDTYIKWYSKNERYMQRVSERANRYLYHIVDELEANDLPLELALLPIVESAFDPFAYSHGRASGIWQFIPGTGKHYGLKQNWWYDGRRDIEASTDAAIRYLTNLHNQFDGDWLLALAAYNTGGGNVRKAIRRNKNKGKPTDFWSLKLPRETRAYVPQLLALAELVRNADQYGLSLLTIPDTPYFERVDLDAQMDLAQAADLAEMSLEDLYHLNPGYNRWATDPEGPYHFLLPIEKADLFRDKLAAMPPRERVSWANYTVKSGDSLNLIAKRFHTSVSALKSANDLRSTMIRRGQTLVIPVASQPVESYAYSQDQRIKSKQARSQGKSGSQKSTYLVKRGDSLWKIANAHRVSVRDVARWNGMAPKDPIKPGQKLVLWSNTQVATQTTNSNGVIRKVNYRVRRGDSLARIAGKFNLSVSDILKWNTMDTKSYIHPGQKITLFVDVTRVN
ncbi:LysM peptidoglycan-binding domain-containing protein [Simiduia aestuariiviva]|uniref:Membrane-bound lytic murein transglycosylase D n=1 Tax=Simiduia aestuariiviva TaxID=1510459 RepID=A0A839UKH2_9GAMM|nr:LysM peptidoglycan-binding domain-containing protein [Simiduia aestuariiviva]MBB3168614.1 membrane-bound lytic murein transglycosylase D [Simiduia aestuariiviva]